MVNCKYCLFGLLAVFVHTAVLVGWAAGVANSSAARLLTKVLSVLPEVPWYSQRAQSSLLFNAVTLSRNTSIVTVLDAPGLKSFSTAGYHTTNGDDSNGKRNDCPDAEVVSS